MELYALIKENGVTNKVTSGRIEAILGPTVRKSMLEIVDRFIEMYGKHYVVTFENINTIDVSDIKCFNIAMNYLKKLIDEGEPEERFFINENVTRNSPNRALSLKERIIKCFISIPIDRDNFDFILKELGLIRVSDSLARDVLIHECKDCKNLSPLICEKAEIRKKKISEYNFITDGFQIFYIDECGKEFLDKFIVRRCRDFVLSESDIPYYKAPNGKPKTMVKKINDLI